MEFYANKIKISWNTLTNKQGHIQFRKNQNTKLQLKFYSFTLEWN